MLFCSRRTIRLLSFSLFGAAVLLSSICMQMHLARRITENDNRLRRAVLARMNEENDLLHTALTEEDPASVRLHADALCGYASMASACGKNGPTEQALLTGIADTAVFYAALSRTAAQTNGDALPDAAFWLNGTDMVSDNLSAMALALTDRVRADVPTEAELAAADRLSSFSAAFETDPIRILTDPHPGYRFEREPIVTPAEARATLQTLIGAAASFLGNTCTDDTHGCYVFSCRNGYAEISRSGGHLLSYAFYPRAASGDSGNAACLINDADLLSLAEAFLQKAGIPYRTLSSGEDRHGVRIFTAETADGACVTVGIRMHDGAAVSFQAEAYYRRTDGADAS